MGETARVLLERLVAHKGGALRAFFLRRGRSQPDATELAQEVYLRMLRVPDLTAIRDLEAYVFTVASNLAREHAVQAGRDSRSRDVDDPVVQQELVELPTLERDIDQWQRVARLREVLSQLPPKCQAVVILHYWHGQSYEEIALRVGVSVNMVKKYVSQALEHCRRRMARLG